MNALLVQLEALIGKELKHRLDGSVVSVVLQDLAVNPSTIFREFVARFVGPSASDRVGYELQDLVEGPWSMLSSTSVARSEFGLPIKYLVISNYFANAALMLDTETDQVFDADFEGGLGELISGNLQPRWPSFGSFLVEFFDLQD